MRTSHGSHVTRSDTSEGVSLEDLGEGWRPDVLFGEMSRMSDRHGRGGRRPLATQVRPPFPWRCSAERLTPPLPVARESERRNRPHDPENHQTKFQNSAGGDAVRRG